MTFLSDSTEQHRLRELEEFARMVGMQQAELERRAEWLRRVVGVDACAVEKAQWDGLRAGRQQQGGGS